MNANIDKGVFVNYVDKTGILFEDAATEPIVSEMEILWPTVN